MTLPLASRIALVTGASRGIGHATARALAKAGAHVVAVARTQGGLEELDDEIRRDGGSATLVPLSLIDFDGIARLGAALHERHGKLDILVGNAGVPGPSSPLGHVELKSFSDVIAVNVTANFQLIRCMEPLLKASDAGRAVFVTSGHTHRHRRRRHGPAVITEVGSPKDFPGTWAGYVVHEGGIRQVVRRIARPDVLRWTERSAAAAFGLWSRWSPGTLDDRCFPHTWPTA